MQHSSHHYILKISCPATSGIVAAVTTFLAQSGCYISEMAQFDDEFHERFFMRAVFRGNSGGELDLAQIEKDFAGVAECFAMQWELHSQAQPMRVLLMVSKYDHCLNDLLYRYHKGEMHMQITAIVSNHLDLRPMAEREGIRFIYLPVTKDNKAQQEAELLKIVQDTQTELVVLARYMQILSDDLCRHLNGRAINIHHSFLPGFKGAKPYHQAWDRGVKLIGATAHYVTADLDQGPIIEQGVERVSHRDDVETLRELGQDVERNALARAVRWHLEDRIIVHGNKTIVFS